VKRILIGAADLLTGDAFSDALLDYAVLLGRAGATGIATIPVIGPDGCVRPARLLLGPGTPIVVLSTDSEHPEPVDADALGELRELARPGPTSAGWADVYDDFDVFGLPGEPLPTTTIAGDEPA
jgi:hypothetical protein